MIGLRSLVSTTALLPYIRMIKSCSPLKRAQAYRTIANTTSKARQTPANIFQDFFERDELHVSAYGGSAFEDPVRHDWIVLEPAELGGGARLSASFSETTDGTKSAWKSFDSAWR